MPSLQAARHSSESIAWGQIVRPFVRLLCETRMLECRCFRPWFARTLLLLNYGLDRQRASGAAWSVIDATALLARICDQLLVHL
jgi:hypothetical protein